MSNINYTNNYRKNLIKYWQQWFPIWEIPNGHQVHHIKPICTFVDRDDPKIHHPSNLIALHPDDHTSIHKNRGDKQLSNEFISIAGRKMSEENKIKRRNYRHTDATKKAISNAHKGKSLSDEHKRKLSENTKGISKPINDEHRKSLSKALKGKPKSDEHKRKISETMKGREVWNKDLKFSDESKLKMSESKKGKNNPVYGKKLYTNGKINKFYIPGTEPNGFIRKCKNK